jgi:hypothetical protein
MTSCWLLVMTWATKKITNIKGRREKKKGRK